MIEPKRTLTVDPVNPSNPSLGPDPLAFWNSVVPRSSYMQISDALDRAANCRFVIGTTMDRQFVELFG
jgi:hypothetical protein